MRRTTKLLVLFLAAYGPLSPAVLLFLIVAPPLILASGWRTWLQALLLGIDVVAIVVAALVFGPSAIEEIRAAFNEGRDHRG
jgi:hypothetical protein